MNQIIYIFSVVLSAVFGFILLGLAGASDTGAPMQWIIPRAACRGKVCFSVPWICHCKRGHHFYNGIRRAYVVGEIFNDPRCHA